MTKSECLDFLEKAQKSYSMHMLNIKNDAEKKFINKKPVILNKERSLIGKWIYDDQSHSKDISGTIFYEELESLHSLWCEEYNKISDVYLKNTKKGLFGRKIDHLSQDKAAAYIDDIQNTTEKISIIIRKIITRVHALPGSRFV